MMKREYINIDFYGADTNLTSLDFEKKFMEKREKYPCFRFYKEGKEIDFVRYQTSWENQ